MRDSLDKSYIMFVTWTIYVHVGILTACCGLLCVFVGVHLDYSSKMVSILMYCSPVFLSTFSNNGILSFSGV